MVLIKIEAQFEQYRLLSFVLRTNVAFNFNVNFFLIFLLYSIVTFSFSASALTEEQLNKIPQQHRLEAEMRNSNYGIVLRRTIGNPGVERILDEVGSVGQKLLSNHPKQNEFQWVFRVIKSEQTNAFAELFEPNDPHFQKHKTFHNLKGDKPIAVVSITTALLKKMKTKSHLALVLGHEIIHHLEGHTKSIKGSGEEIFSTLVHRQSLEVVADKGAVDLMIGKYRIETSPEVFENVLPADHTTPKDNDDNFNRAAKASVTTHHHRGPRIGALQTYSNFLLSTVPDASLPIEEPIGFSLGDFKFRQSQNQVFNFEFKQKLENALAKAQFMDPFSIEYIKEIELLHSMIGKNIFEFRSGGPLFSDITSKLEALNLTTEKRGQILLLFLTHVTADMYNPNNISASNQVDAYLKNLSALERVRIKRWLSQVRIQPPYIHTQLPKAWRNGFIHLFLTSRELPVESTFSQNSSIADWSKIVSHDYFIEKKDNDINDRKDMVLVFIRNDFKPTLLLSEFVFQAIERHLNKDETEKFEHKDILNLYNFISNEEFVKATDNYKLTARRQDVMSELKKNFDQTIQDAVKNSAWHSPIADKRDISTKSRLFNTWLLGFALNSDQHPDDLFDFLDSFTANKSTMNVYSSLFNLSREDLPKDLIFKNFFKFFLDNQRNDSFFSDLAKIFTILQSEKKNFNSLLKDPQMRNQLRREFYRHRNMDPEGFKKFIFTWLTKESISDPNLRAPPVFTFTGFSGKIELLYGLGLKEIIFKDKALREQIFEIFDTYYQTEDGRSYSYRLSLERFVVDYLVNYLEQNSSLDLSVKMLKRIVLYLEDDVAKNFILDVEDRVKVEALLKAKIDVRNEAHRQLILKEPHILKYLSEEHITDILMTEFKSNRKSTTQSEFETWNKFNQEYPEAIKRGSVENLFRIKVTQEYTVQPQDYQKFTNDTGLSDSAHGKTYTHLVRSYSGIISFIGNLNLRQQTEVVDFLMGRRNTQPNEIVDLVEPSKAREFNRQFNSLRYELDNSPIEKRALFLNSIFHSHPDGLLSVKGREALFNQLKSQFVGEDISIVKDIYDALHESQGRDFSLLMSFILAQKHQGDSKTEITQEWILRVILESFGVPGIKFGQYLAFTGEFKKFEKSLLHFQDSVSIPDYFSVIKYLQTRYGEKWDFTKNPIVRILGAGSVNLAIEYFDSKSGENKVMNIPREHVELKSKIDFARFKPFLEKLAIKKPSYQYLMGLADLIQDSVTLEFDKVHADKMQTIAETIYDRKIVDGWSIRTVKTDGLVDTIQILEKAGSISAVKANAELPSIYKNSMSALYQFEYQRIFKGVQNGKWQIANPDLHDGQVFINPKTKEVTVIDFGQAVTIDGLERQFGMDILSDIAQAKLSSSVYANLDGWFQHLAPGRGNLDQKKLEEIFNSKDTMDRFIKLVSHLNSRGLKVPLSTVHFILSVNRLVKLGLKVGKFSNYQIGFDLYTNHFRNLMKRYSSNVKELIKNVIKPTNACLKFYK